MFEWYVKRLKIDWIINVDVKDVDSTFILLTGERFHPNLQSLDRHLKSTCNTREPWMHEN
jgi:hypothetical protein